MRAPVQERSRKRVGQILEAAKAIALAKGCAGLTTSALAKEAGITIASIYQYFPNRSAIILALGEHYLDTFHARLVGQLAERPPDRAALRERLLVLVDRFYEFYRDDPVVRDIWMGAATDKQLQTLDAQDTARNLSVLREVAEPLFVPADHDELDRVLGLFMQFAVTATRMALDVSGREREAVVASAKSILAAGFDDFCARHPAPSAS